jgi:hypothetical protein
MSTWSRITFTGAVALLVAVPGLSQASGGGDAPRVTATGACSSSSTWKLDTKERDGGLEVEFEVDSNRVGESWSYQISRNGSSVAAGQATTAAPSGSFDIEVAIPGGTIAEPVTALATHAGTGEKCDTTAAGAPAPGTTAPSDDTAADDRGRNRSTPGDDQSGRQSGGRGTDAVTCSDGATAKLKAKRRDGRVEVEFEVDSNRSGQVWKYRLLRDDTVAARGRATTGGRSGSFSVERRLADGPGRATYRGVARQPATDQVCKAAVTR